MKNSILYILLATAGLLIVGRKLQSSRHSGGLKTEADGKIVSLVIGSGVDGKYPVEIEWVDGIISKEVHAVDEMKTIIAKAQADGARIVEDTGGAADNPSPAAKSYTFFEYREIDPAKYYVRIAYYDGTKREGEIHKDVFDLYLRNAKRDGATIKKI